MPVTLAVFYLDYCVQRENGTLDASGTHCPGYPESCDHAAPLLVTKTTVERIVFMLDQDRQSVVKLTVLIVLGKCPVCGARPRLLPADILPRKHYGLVVIEALLAEYNRWDKGLRQVAWSHFADRTPQHTTLHAWTEGLGAYALGRPGGEVPDALPASRMLAEVEARHGAARAARTRPVNVDPSRYRSEPRHERLRAECRVVWVCQTAGCPPAETMAWVNRQMLRWGNRHGIGFRTGILSTPIGHLVRGPPAN